MAASSRPPTRRGRGREPVLARTVPSSGAPLTGSATAHAETLGAPSPAHRALADGAALDQSPEVGGGRELGSTVFLGPINRSACARGSPRRTRTRTIFFGGVPPPRERSGDRAGTAGLGPVRRRGDGPLVLQDSTPLAQDVVDFIEAGSPPVYVGFGSMRARMPRRRHGYSWTASRPRPPLVAQQGLGGPGIRDALTSVKVVADRCRTRSSSRVAAVVHHGGAGTLATALRAGSRRFSCPRLRSALLRPPIASPRDRAARNPGEAAHAARLAGAIEATPGDGPRTEIRGRGAPARRRRLAAGVRADRCPRERPCLAPARPARARNRVAWGRRV
jgi:hypothetical protein